MFDVAPTELMLIAVVALIVIGPKDLPKAMRFVGYWVGRSRNVMRQFRSGFDSMVREAELQEMEKKWAAENERIMREHEQPSSVLPEPMGAVAGGPVIDNMPEDGRTGGAIPVMTEQPAIVPATPPSEPAPGGEAPQMRGTANS